jgi:hypothetical protein
MNEPRDPKGYTALINPLTGRMELTLAVIPLPGDSDYHPKNINNYIQPKDILPRASPKCMYNQRVPQPWERFVDRKPQPWEQFVEREPEYWEIVSLKDVPTPSQRADAVALARALKDEELKSWRESISVDSLLR